MFAPLYSKRKGDIYIYMHVFFISADSLLQRQKVEFNLRQNKSGSRGAAHAAMSLRWSVN